MRYYGYAFRDDNLWFTAFPDFQGAMSQGDTLAQAMECGRQVLGYAVEELRKSGRRLPEPSDADAVIARAMRDEDALEDGTPIKPVLYSVNIPNANPAPVKVNISLKAGELSDIDERAKELGLSRSALMVKGALAYGE